jgi:hypothetical protein
LVEMAGLRARGARRLWAWGCRWASSRLIAPAAGKGDDDGDPQIRAGQLARRKKVEGFGTGSSNIARACLRPV